MNTIYSDGVIGQATWGAVFETPKPFEEKQSVFCCPHCGGNATETHGSKVICAYCHSELQTRKLDMIKSVEACLSYARN